MEQMEYRCLLPYELQRFLLIYSGLFICHDWKNKANIKDPEGHGLIPSEIAEAVRGSMEAGATGVCLFVPGNMTDEHWIEFDKAIHQTYQVKK